MSRQAEEHERWLAALLQPLALAGTSLPNRLMMSALTLQYGEGGLMSDRHVAFYRERARGGTGLLFSEQLAASPLSDSPFQHALRAHDERQIARYRRVVAAVSPHGTKFFVQLFCAGAAGRSTTGLSRWQPVRAPSAVPAPGGEVPSPLTVEEIARLTDDHVCSARYAIEGGVHGLELHGAHGWLLGQFLSPWYNQRTDAYGGSVENRCRLVLEIGAAVRREVGAGVPLGLALTYDELLGEAGITPADTLAQLEVMSRAAVFDFFDLSIGSSHHQHHTIASMAVSEGFALPFAARARATVQGGAAIFVSGRVVDPLAAGRAIAAGDADVIGMARAQLADPRLLAKSRRGQSRHITRCVGANHCVARALGDEPVTCVLTPRTGREAEWKRLPRVRTALSIAVAGAGPAGLHFARIAAEAGHRVRVFEREATPGGHLAVLSRLPTRENWRRAIEDMTRALRRAGAVLQLETPVTPELLLEGGYDRLVIATGARWAVPEWLGGDVSRRPACWPLDGAILQATSAPSRTIARHAMIVDGTGTYTPLGLAEVLLQAGTRVTLVTRQESVGAVAARELELPHLMPRLEALGLRVITHHEVAAVDADCVRLASIWGSARQDVGDVDALVLADARVGEAGLADTLRGRHPAVHLLGDARAPRTTAAVIHEAEALAREFSAS